MTVILFFEKATSTDCVRMDAFFSLETKIATVCPQRADYRMYKCSAELKGFVFTRKTASVAEPDGFIEGY
jgi:hypothetical protein